MTNGIFKRTIYNRSQPRIRLF